MDKLAYDRKRIRKAMLLAPAVGTLGIVPFLLPLNVTILQFLLALLGCMLLVYLVTLIVGTPGYLLLRAARADRPAYLIGYAAALVILAALLLGDGYALLSFGPAALLTAGAFCYFRGGLSENGPAATTGTAPAAPATA